MKRDQHVRDYKSRVKSFLHCPPPPFFRRCFRPSIDLNALERIFIEFDLETFDLSYYRSNENGGSFFLALNFYDETTVKYHSRLCYFSFFLENIMYVEISAVDIP